MIHTENSEQDPVEVLEEGNEQSDFYFTMDSPGCCVGGGLWHYFLGKSLSTPLHHKQRKNRDCIDFRH